MSSNNINPLDMTFDELHLNSLDEDWDITSTLGLPKHIFSGIEVNMYGSYLHWSDIYLDVLTYVK